MRVSQIVAMSLLVLTAALHLAGSQTLGEEAAVVRLATFRCDVTPPLKGKFFGGWDQPLTKLEDPLWAKGIVLDDGGDGTSFVPWTGVSCAIRHTWRFAARSPPPPEPTSLEWPCSASISTRRPWPTAT